MLTAEEARKLMPKTLKEKVNDILEAVAEAARNGKSCLRTGWDYKNDEELWSNGGYSRTDEWCEAQKILEELGYKVTFYYRDAQFVDMYTWIQW